MNLDDYTRIGRWCHAKRRSIWCRINPRPKVVEGDAKMYVASPDNVESIDLCAGREGDDARVRIDASNPQFAGILNLLLCGMYAAELDEEYGEVKP